MADDDPGTVPDETRPPPGGPDAALAPPMNRTDALLAKSMAETNEMFRESIKRADINEAERRAETAPIRERMLRTMDEPKPELHQEKVPPAPKQNIQQEIQEFMGSAMMIGAIGSLAGRSHATNALNAFAGAVQGYKQGREDDFKARLQEWEAAVKGIKDNNEIELKQYKAVFENRKLTTEEQAAELQLIASEHQNRAVYESARTGNLLHAAQAYQQLVVHTDRIAKTAQDMRLAVERNDRAREAEKRRATEFEQKQAGRMTPERADARAERYFAGAKDVFQNLSRGAAGLEAIGMVDQAIMNLARKKGMTQEELVKIRRDIDAQTYALRTTYTQEAKIGLVINEMQRAVPAAEAAIDNYWGNTNNHGVSALSWNTAQNLFDEQSQEPALNELAAALNAVVSPYGSVMARGNQGDAETRKVARHLLTTANSPDAAKAQLRFMEWEVQNALAAPGMTRQQILNPEATKKLGPPPLTPRRAGGPNDIKPINPRPNITPPSPTEIPRGQTLTRPDGTFVWDGTQWLKQ